MKNPVPTNIATTVRAPSRSSRRLGLRGDCPRMRFAATMIDVMSSLFSVPSAMIAIFALLGRCHRSYMDRQ